MYYGQEQGFSGAADPVSLPKSYRNDKLTVFCSTTVSPCGRPNMPTPPHIN